MTNDELRNAIAERLGWKYDPTWCKTGTWIAPNGTLWHHCPNWPEDVNAALTLVKDVNFSLHNEKRPMWRADIWSWTALPDGGGWRRDGAIGSDQSIARAICLAVLDYERVVHA